jgi:hypothetical protein
MLRQPNKYECSAWNASIVLTKHARDRLTQRGISTEEISKTIRRPTRRQRLPDERNKWAFRRKTRGRMLEVVLYWFQEENRFIVKTAYFV